MRKDETRRRCIGSYLCSARDGLGMVIEMIVTELHPEMDLLIVFKSSEESEMVPSHCALVKVCRRGGISTGHKIWHLAHRTFTCNLSSSHLSRPFKTFQLTSFVSQDNRANVSAVFYVELGQARGPVGFARLCAEDHAEADFLGS